MLTTFIVINLFINLFMFFIFEIKKPSVREFLPMAVICAAASIGRMIFSFIPQAQPVTAIIIITGSSFGSLFGYVTGSLCALISNMMLGQGPWTLFQMTAWGSVGFIAGIIGHLFKKGSSYLSCSTNDITVNSFSPNKKFPLKKREFFELTVFSLYGFASAILFSVITDTLTICYLGDSLTFASAMSVFITGILFNIGHGIFNTILIILLYIPMKRNFISSM